MRNLQEFRPKAKALPCLPLTFILLFLFLAGCAQKGTITPEQIELKGEQLNELSRSKVIQVVDEPYLGVKVIAVNRQNDPILDIPVTLRRKGTLRELCSAISGFTSLSVQVIEEESDVKVSVPTKGVDPALEDLVFPVSSDKTFAISYEGTFRGLLDHIAAISGNAWDYRAGSVIFSRFQIQTFTVLSVPGNLKYSNTLTNKSKETTSSGGSGMNQTVATADTSTQNSQTNSVDLSIDVWKEVTTEIKALLSSKGTVTSSQAAGTVTVRDNAARIRQVSKYIKEVNERFQRQVALQIQVWALELNDDSEAGLNLQAIFRNENLAIIAGSLTGLGGSGSTSVAVVSGQLKDSTAVLRALKEWGTTSVVTSGSGIIMSNMPFPIQAIKRHGYLAAVSTTTNTDYGQTAELTPGEVTDGFAMTVIPHILDKRRVILQYNVNLSHLDALVEFTTADATIQLPQVSTRSFAQRTALKMGQTLVLAGFQQETQQTSNSIGMFGGGRSSDYGKTLLVITIQVESAEI